MGGQNPFWDLCSSGMLCDVFWQAAGCQSFGAAYRSHFWGPSSLQTANASKHSSV